MRILFVADGRSPTALNWLKYWVEKGYLVHLISTFPADTPAGMASFDVVPVAFGRMAGAQQNNTRGPGQKPGWIGKSRRSLRILRYYLGPLGLPAYKILFRKKVEEIRPDLVHALRIPFEGMLASTTPAGIPLVLSVWGNDITLHAHGSPLMAASTRQALQRVDGLIADTQRDINLGQKWGFQAGKLSLIVPGSGGIRFDEILKDPGIVNLPEELPDVPIIVNPRGQRPGSLRQDVFIRAIPAVLEKNPQVVFVCPSLGGDDDTERLVDSLGIRNKVKLWPRLNQPQLWYLFRRSQIFVSPSLHDGTPNSLLEVMACGCFPIVGNIESMREWIKTGVNGLLVDATDTVSIADAICLAINQPALRMKAAKYNATLIAERADYTTNMGYVENLYQGLRIKK